MATNGLQSSYACRCLNVQIHPLPAQGSPPAATNDFDPVYVSDEGIAVSHTQVTLRIRSPARQEHGETSEYTRYTSLTCLICHCLVYRVLQLLDPEVDHGEGPVLPSDDWAEQDLLKSASGWIEVSRECMAGEAVSQAEASTSYSKLYKVLLPPGSSSISFLSAPPSSSPENSPQASRRLPPLPSLFLPPPFTPNHSVFNYLSSIAVAESEKVRDAAEEYLAKVAEEKAAEIKAVEVGLKQEVERLWSKFKEGLENVHQDSHASGRPTSSMSGRRLSSGRWTGLTSPGAGSGSFQPSSVRISEFVPTQNLPDRTSSRTPPRQVTSALSASLVSSSFHHPRAQQVHDAANPRDDTRIPRSPPTPTSPSSSPHSSATRVVSPSTASSRTVAMGINGESSSIREAYRRNMDQSKDIATSFRYVVGMEEQTNAYHAPRTPSSLPEALVSPNAAGSSSAAALPRGRSPRAGKSSIKKAKKEEPPSRSQEKSSAISDKAPGNVQDTSPKGKRKVTFDVQPAVAIIESESAEVDQSEPNGEDTIFDMEGEELAEALETASDPPELVNGESSPLQDAEPDLPRSSVRRTRPRIQDNYGLPSSLSSLRPTSLPNPSSMRSLVRRDDAADRPRSQAVRESVVTTFDSQRSPVNGHHDTPGAEDIDDSPDPREAEILRLVAASTPSHRSAWKKDSKAWKMFVSRQDRRSRDPGPVAIEEEDEDDTSPEYDGPRLGRQVDDHGADNAFDDDERREYEILRDHETSMVSSLPIPIMPIGAQFGPASYQPKTSLTERPGVLVPALHTSYPSSSAAMRRAVYAERDRNRSIDPGALEFTEDLDADEDRDTDTEVGSLGRRRAMKILEARNELPDAGMWRSLA